MLMNLNYYLYSNLNSSTGTVPGNLENRTIYHSCGIIWLKSKFYDLSQSQNHDFDLSHALLGHNHDFDLSQSHKILT